MSRRYSIIRRGALGQAENGNGPDYQEAGLSAAEAYLASDGDVLALFEPLFAFMGTAALALPPPFNVVAAIANWVLSKMVTVIRGYLERTAMHVGRYCTVNTSAGVLQSMKDAWFTWSTDCIKDKIVQESKKNKWLKAGLLSANFFADEKDELNLNVRTRTAKRTYDTCVRNGAAKADAATAAFYVGKDAGAPHKDIIHYARIAGAKTSWELASPAVVWKKRNAGLVVPLRDINLKTIKDPVPPGGGNAMLYGAVGVAALLLLMRARGR
jgi:hypothetical protein